MNSIEIRELRKSYRDVRAVDGITLSIARGEIMGLLGPNGAGKTTTVEILAGIRDRDAGEVSVLGEDPARGGTQLRARIGIQLQDISLFPRLRAGEILELFASFYPSPLSVKEVLSAVNLSDRRDALTSELSGGQLRRLSVATALVGNPEILFLDEPSTGLDPRSRRRLWDLVSSLGASGKTILLTTHYMEEAERLCDRVAVMDRGRVIAMGAPHDLINRSFSERVIEFSPPSHEQAVDLAGLPGVTRVQQTEETVSLHSERVSATLGALLEGEQGRVEDFTVRGATLEDLFLKLTGRRIRE